MSDATLRPAIVIWTFWKEVRVIEETAELLQPVYLERSQP